MKIFLTLLCGCAVTLAHGQTTSAQTEPTDPNEQLIWNTYVKLQADASYELSLSGTKTVAGVTKSFSSTLYFSTSIDPRTNLDSVSKVELDDYDTTGQQPVLVHRYVGNGANLWFYDVANQRYSSTFYSFYGNSRPANLGTSDAPEMLAQLDAVVKGPSEYMVRMLREINFGLNAHYATWAPGEVTVQPLTEPPSPDPLVPSRSYSSSSSEEWVLYGPPPPNTPNYYRVAPNRSVAFQIDNVSGDANAPDWRLSAVYFAEQTHNAFTDWSIQVTDPLLTVPSWAYQPYNAAFVQGWEPIQVFHRYVG